MRSIGRSIKRSSRWGPATSRPISAQIATLFANNEQGVWYDIDPKYCYQDAAGTVPAVVGQPVGLVLDRSKGLALGPELVTNGTFDTDVAGWFSADPDTVALSWEDGAARVVVNPASFGSIISQSFPTVAGRTYKVSVQILSNTGNSAVLFSQTSTGGATTGIAANMQAGTYSGVFRATTGSSRIGIGNVNSATSSRLIDNISVRELPGNHAYQTTATSRPILRHDAVTGAYYLEFDGSDDWLVTNSIDFTATDKVTVWAGVRKLSDATIGMIAELSVNTGPNNGSFALWNGGNAGGSPSYRMPGRGTASVTQAPTGIYSSPISNVIVATHDIGGDQFVARINAVQVGAASGYGIGNFGNYPLYIGRRGGTSLPFNGHLYGLTIRGAQSTEAQIKLVERYLDMKLTNPKFTDFDFSSLPIDPRITFTRASTATYFDSDGVMQTAAINQPRIDHDPVTGEVRGLLVEEQRTNLVKYSGDFAGAGWAQGGVTAIESADGPAGPGTAKKITAIGGGPCWVRYGYNAAEFNSLPLWTSSVYVKAGTYKYARLSQSTAANAIAVTINLEDGTYVGATHPNVYFTVTPVGNGWYRVTLTRNNVYQYPCFALYLTNYSGPNDPGILLEGTYPNAGEYIYAWAPQFEPNASFPTSYIHTEGTAMTRAADVAAVNSLSSIRYNPAEGAVFVDGAQFEGQNSIPDRSRSGGLYTSGLVALFAFYNGARLISQTPSPTKITLTSAFNPTNGKAKYAYAYKSSVGFWGTGRGNTPIELPGGEVADGSLASLLRISGTVSGGVTYSGHIRRLRYYPRRLSNTELQELTA